ncbi:hypothetical protein GUJ93_ZPchr0001g29861 [Zizania palustris]|uniref:PB1 domain-containing protein n=1 Tax=Zizania palustris TaxID=103762 RepID=A0A8J5RMB5_ZIZPA|nr:hypothetical protein GUJ93_ZPchr0001g29861 [Zizania palustris]
MWVADNRVLSVNRALPFYEAVSLRCQLPTEELDALVSITSDDDLANLLEEYDRPAVTALAVKIHAFLFPRLTPMSPLSRSPPTTPSSPSASRMAARVPNHHQTRRAAPSCTFRWAAVHQVSPPVRFAHHHQQQHRHGGVTRPERYHVVQNATII